MEQASAREAAERRGLGALATAGARVWHERVAREVVLFVASEIAKALAYAHRRQSIGGTPAPIVHRDLSPGNILVTNEGGVLLTDFGIAKVQHGERTRTGDIKRRAPHMAPEQSHGGPLDGRSDLFALGVSSSSFSPARGRSTERPISRRR